MSVGQDSEKTSLAGVETSIEVRKERGIEGNKSESPFGRIIQGCPRLNPPNL